MKNEDEKAIRKLRWWKWRWKWKTRMIVKQSVRESARSIC